jgi:hypothetical protein
MQALASSKASCASPHFRLHRLLFEYNIASAGSSLIACAKPNVKGQEAQPVIPE